ncbi:MAG TPA: hypothetical protein VGE41_07465 [Verrucomicrobiae bacterium]
MDTYWTWALGGATLPNDAHGNAVVKGVALMAFPSAPGDGTPGSIDITLSAGEGFAIPFFAFLGNSYSDGTPPDTFAALSVFQTLDISVTLDGVTIVDGSNVMQYFTEFYFNPAIPLNSPPANAWIWAQTVGVVHAPLPVGNHVMKMHVRNTEPAYGFTFEYNNTWNIHVTGR